MGFFVLMKQIEELYRHYLKFPNISTDTRKDVTDTIFFALSGDNFNGNKFAEIATSKGAAIAVIDDAQYAKGDNYFLVENVLSSLQELAKFHRTKLSIPVLGITGSNGKTTTKELASAVLASEKKVISTQGNLNNHIGVPLTILSIREETEIAVVEMGANHEGEIKLLCEIARPDAGIITNIGKAHLEGFGSLEGVIRAKSELYNYLELTNGKIILNQDDELLKNLSDGISAFSYGSKDADVNGKTSSLQPSVSIEWAFKEKSHQLHTQLYGAYNFPNIMAAIATGIYFGISPENINTSLGDYIPQNNRSQVLSTPSNTIVLDAYNANPVSMSTALESFRAANPENPWLILGDMFELGKYSEMEHREIVDLIQKLKFEHYILVGKDFANLNLPDQTLRFITTQEAYAYLEKNPIQHAQILIKGSRGMKMESLLNLL